VELSVTDDAIEKIKAMILSGELKPGDRLPVEKTLATDLGLSRNSLREAVRALTTLRVLETRQGAGTFVTSLAPGHVLDAMRFIVDFHDLHSAADFLEVRRILEAEASARAARLMTDDEVEHVRQLNDDMRQLALAPHLDVARFIALDREFHAAITGSCGNPALAALTEMLGGQTSAVRSMRVAAHKFVAAAAVDEHSDIVNALAIRDGELARLRSAVHVARVEEWARQQATDN
jgi:GntR family transcriptional regulator, transcriptional repressor for pyruvate dehydrogenase complex